MTYRIGWLSPLTPASGVGTFSHAVTEQFPREYEGQPVELTILYVGHDRIYDSKHRAVKIGEDLSFHRVLSLFDVLIYNIGNNREHHQPVYDLLRAYPGVVICHDFVYQDYLAHCAQCNGGKFSSLAALLFAFNADAAPGYMRRSRFTSRLGQARYHPWGTPASVEQPMSEAILCLGSALVVHSGFAQRHAEQAHPGPIARLGLPDQKNLIGTVGLPGWAASLATKVRFELVSFGHIQGTKCIDLVVSALAASPLLRRRVHYTVAGSVNNASYFDHLKAMVTQFSLQGCVTFELEVPDARLTELMEAADIFANLRRPNTEGASGSLAEQLATGKPVLVIDSGSYADVPSDAAIKLPPNVTSNQIREVLEKLIAEPDSMPAIGEAGRAFAASWSCASYSEALLRFVLTHRQTLEARGKFVAPQRQSYDDGLTDPWLLTLARARRSLAYFDRNLLAVDPELVLAKTHRELCAYTAHVIFGIFDDTLLDRALSGFFVRLEPQARYWGCVRLALVADAAFGDDETARERLVNLRPCYETEFWSVIVALPARQCLAAATLLLLERRPTEAELSVVGLDDDDGFPKRLRLADLVQSTAPQPASALAQLAQWLGASHTPQPDAGRSTSQADFKTAVGTVRFKERVDLSGFYPMEDGRAWTRGNQAFIGLRLVERQTIVEVLVHHICASAERPAAISLAHEGVETRVVVSDCIPRWLSIAVRPSVPSDLLWLRLATDVTAVPDASADTRLLGLCFLEIRVGASQDAAAVVPLGLHTEDDHPPIAGGADDAAVTADQDC